MSSPNNPVRFGIRLPVIVSMRITGYQLYPGRKDEGIDFDFRPGVTVIAGINGLGKTTLLHALYRALTGPADTGIRAGAGELGAQVPRASPWSSPSYFRSRVEDEARNARIAITVAVGDRWVRIERALRDLKLVSLILDESQQPTGESVYRSLITELTGFARFEDFLLCLQFLVFVTEDRPALVWDRTAQFELFRILIADAPRALELRNRFDSVQRTDSARRNLRAQYNRIVNQLRKARAQQQGNRELLTEVEGLQRELESVEADIARLAPELERMDGERHRLRERRAQSARDLEESLWRYAALEQQHFRHVLPDVAQTAALVFLRSDSGCLVCGDRSDRASERLKSQLSAHRCPFCDSRTNAEGRKDGVSASGNAERLAEAAEQVNEAREVVQTLERDLDVVLSQFRSVADTLAGLQRQREGLRERLRGTTAQLPPPPETMEKLDSTARTIEGQLEELQREQVTQEAAFSGALDSLRVNVQALQDHLQERFHSYASAFLSESCDLVYSVDERRIGQEGQRFSFPRFSIFMTNALSPEEGRRRMGPQEVSESQREFIDLAFRMALIEVAAGGGSAMLVLETPEASLDGVFMARAGRQLTEFAYRGHGVGNRLIATSNLTEGRMISALLGAIGPTGSISGAAAQPHYVPPEERPSRVINLLEVAAPSRALREFREAYDQAYSRAVYPDISRTQTSSNAPSDE